MGNGIRTSDMQMSRRWRNVEAAQTCGDRIVPSWEIRQTQRRQQRIAWTLLRGALMLGVMFVTITLIARAL